MTQFSFLSPQSPSRFAGLRKVIALFAVICLLLPILASVVLAAPNPDAHPVWNGGAAEAFNGSGIESDPYRITSGEELALLAQLVRAGDRFDGAYFLLTEDIHLNTTANYADWQNTPPSRHWIPIGGYASLPIDSEDAFRQASQEEDGLFLRTEEGYQPAATYTPGVIYYRLTAFGGVFEGDGHSISGLYVTEEENYAGLFGACRDAIIKNLRIESAFVHSDEYAGLLSGAFIASENSIIDNVTVQGTLIATQCAGGLIGYAETVGTGKLTVNACDFSGKVTGETAIGGILGKTGAGSGSVILSSCENHGEITANTEAGGILGSLSGAGDQLLYCKNSGSIYGDRHIGGIAGMIAPVIGVATVTECQNGGVLLAESLVGGIAGSAVATANGSSIEFLACRNIGDLHGSDSLGGIVGNCELSGEDDNIRLSGNKNSALISGKTRIGGIIGNAQVRAGNLTIGSCENYGSITASLDLAGGILGEGTSATQLTISRVSVRATIIAGDSHAGGIVGRLTADLGAALLELSAANGSVTSPAAAGGIAGELVSKGPGSTAEIRNCLAVNTLSATESVGGIAGLLYTDSATVTVSSCIFGGGIVSGCQNVGGIAADLHAENTNANALVQNCYFSQNAASTVMHAHGGKGSESATNSAGCSDEALRDPRQLTTLDSDIWKGDSEGKHILLPGDIPFVWEEYQYTVTQNGAILLAYLGRSDIAHIPERLGGVQVTTLSEMAFWHSNVIRVVLPDSITAIGEAAFAGCSNLERVTLPTSLVSVGARAFSECPSLAVLRCTKLLSTLVVGSENEPFQALTITRPITVQVSHVYEDGTIAGKGNSLSCYIGDYYQVDALDITGYEADESVLSGICDGSTRISVVYRIGTYHLTVRYLYPDGSEAFPSFEGDFKFGDTYSISTPILEGFKADNTLLEGKMGGSDTQLVVYYTEIFDNNTQNSEQTLQIVLLILSGLVMVCCLVYFIYRYRSATEHTDTERN